MGYRITRVDHHRTTTSFELPGHRIVQNLGVVRGVSVRSRALPAQIASSLRTVLGGRIQEYVELCEDSRQEAFEQMVRHANELGANAIVGIHYDATELSENMNEVLAYGTAVVVEPT